jgi:hypothetical protein
MKNTHPTISKPHKFISRTITIITEKGRTHNQLRQKYNSQPHEFDFILKSYSQSHEFDFILRYHTTSISFSTKLKKLFVLLLSPEGGPAAPSPVGLPRLAGRRPRHRRRVGQPRVPEAAPRVPAPRRRPCAGGCATPRHGHLHRQELRDEIRKMRGKELTGGGRKIRRRGRGSQCGEEL